MAGTPIKLNDGDIALYITPVQNYIDVNNRILDYYITEQKFYCVYVTMNRPYTAMAELFKKRKLDLENVFFIDAVTPMHTSSIFRSGNAVFIGSPRNLTSMSIVLSSTMKNDGKRKILFLDSLSAMMIYNGAETGTKFMNHLISLMRMAKISSVIISLEKETDEKVLEQLSRMCDKVVEMK